MANIDEDRTLNEYIILREAGNQRLQVAEAIHEFTEIGLKRSIALVDAAPIVMGEYSRERARYKDLESRLEKLGAVIEFKTGDIDPNLKIPPGETEAQILQRSLYIKIGRASCRERV